MAAAEVDQSFANAVRKSLQEKHKASLTQLLDTVREISEELSPSDTHFFIKGGAAVPFLLEEDYGTITNDIDTMLLINPSLSKESFEETRTNAIYICIKTIANKFSLDTPIYEGVDESLGKIMEKPIRKGPASSYRLIINGDIQAPKLVKQKNGSFIEKYVSLEYSLIQLFKQEGKTRRDLLDIVIPNAAYPLLNYYWHTIVPIPIPYAEGKTVPVIDIVSAYVNQEYTASKSHIQPNIKRKTRANILLKKLTTNKTKTRKANRTKNLPANEAGLFRSIVGTLPNNTNVVTTSASGGAGAGAGAGAATASSSSSLPLLPASPSLSPTHRPIDPRRNALEKGAKWIVPRKDDPYTPLYTEEHVFLSPAEDYVLRRYTNGTIDEILDFRTDELLTRIEYVGDPARNGQMFYKVFSNGKWYTRFNPATSYFDPITMKVYLRRR
jgi:hypothetical protein